MSKQKEQLTSRSEEATLNTRGFKLVQKLGQGSYAKVCGTYLLRLSSLLILFFVIVKCQVYLGEFIRPVKDDKEETNDEAGASATVAVVKLACKVIDTKKAPSEFVRKFLPRELKILLQLKHPHVIYTHNIFQRRHKYYIFMR